MNNLHLPLAAVLAAALLLGGCSDSSSTTAPPLGGDTDIEDPDRFPGGPGQRPPDVPPGPPATISSVPVTVDWHNRKTPPRAPGEFDLLTLSTMPDTVTGGDVLVGVRGLEADDTLTVLRNGTDVSAVFQRRDDGDWHGLVEGLELGNNVLIAKAAGPAGHRRAVLEVTNHPISGPVLSGPHQQPFYCRTEQAGLGEPLDADCSAPTQYQWYYRSVDQGFKPLDDPYGPYPRDVMATTTSDGQTVPWVVRLESATINRGIARIAVLDDPAARGPETPFEPALWNRRVYYVYGESCGVGYHQGNSRPELVLGGFPDPTEISDDNLLIILAGVSDRLGRGDIIAHNTLSSFGVHCNPLISIETSMMMREHITERYGIVERLIGTNGSGGALQQYNAANNAPGLLSAGLPSATFADIPSTAMTVADCGLLQNYFRRDDVSLRQYQQAAITGHSVLNGTALNSICASWEDTFLDRLDPTRGCSVPAAERYHPVDNPSGVRCTIQDANVNIFGVDPQTGFARRPLDNTGVQYGLQAFNKGVIGFDEFLALNRDIGGYDIDGQPVAERMVMDPEVERITYEIGGVIGRGALAETPFIDVAPYLDLIPVANIHEAVRPFTVRARLRPRAGGGHTQSIFRGVLTQPDVFPLIDRWLDNIAAADRPADADPVATVIAAKPYAANDRCSFGTIGGRLDLRNLKLPLGAELPVLSQLETILPLPGVNLVSGLIGGLLGDDGIALRVDVPEDFDLGLGPCSLALPVTATPRMAAGMPLSDDVIKCQLKPVTAGDYRRPLSDDQLAQLREVFPEGVCDWSRPAAWDVHRSMLWPSLGGRERASQPFALEWQAARALVQ